MEIGFFFFLLYPFLLLSGLAIEFVVPGVLLIMRGQCWRKLPNEMKSNRDVVVLLCRVLLIHFLYFANTRLKINDATPKRIKMYHGDESLG